MRVRTEAQLEQHREYMRAWKNANPEKVKQHSKRKWEAIKNDVQRLERHRAYHRDYKQRTYNANRAIYSATKKRQYIKHRDSILTKRRNDIWNLKVEVLGHYGKVCGCCGESNIKLLCLDHTNNNGAVERKAGLRSGHVFYAKLKKAGFPPGYQTLCYNCNCAKGFYGTCPHKEQAILALSMIGAC